MRLSCEIKAHCLFAMIGSLVLCSNAVASSVEILVDAALDQTSLKVANDATLHIVDAAGKKNLVGVVVYDDVFQRSTELLPADEVHAQRISQVHTNITPSISSNIAVGIEKGISELGTAGGLLLVFGNNDILQADAEAVNKYRAWLQLVLLPDAANKSISIVLASPQNAQPTNLNSLILEYPDNRVISFSDTSDVIEQLSGLLPFQLPDYTQVAQETPVDAPTAQSPIAEPIASAEPPQTQSLPKVDLPIKPDEIAIGTDQVIAEPIASAEPPQTQTLPKVELPVKPDEIAIGTDQVAAPAGAGQTEVSTIPTSIEAAAPDAIQDKPNFKLLILFAILALLVILAVAITMFILKRNRKPKSADSSFANPSKSRYLAPNHAIATALTTRATESNDMYTNVKPASQAMHGFPDSDEFDDSVFAASELVEDEPAFNSDITAPRDSVRSDAMTPNVESDATVERPAMSPHDDTIPNELDVFDELEELKSLTQSKQRTLS